MIIRYAVPEMWRETDVIVIFILGNFYPFTPPPPITPKNGNFKKVKKKTNKQNKGKPGGIIILHMCTKNHDHMLRYFWDIWCVMDVIVIFHFGLFLPFYPPNIPKNENFKKMKKRKKNTWRYHQFTQVHHKSWSYAILFLGYGVRQIFHFGLFFALLAP